MGRSADQPRHSEQTDGDDSQSPILHVDMDAFFASVEIRRHPELRGRPVIVGGGRRGVVSAASYAARRYGISSAMPMTTALRRCPHAVVLPPDHATYSQVSTEIMAILGSFTPLVEPLSLDEAFLDVSAARRQHGRPADIARQIRARVAAEQQLTCSVGIAPSKFVAKIASARCKPDGLLVIPASGVLAFLHPLPITALWGVGPSTAARLHRLGLRTVGDVAETPLALLTRAVGSAAADHLRDLADARDPRAVEPGHVEKSISADRTFETDLTDRSEIDRALLHLSDEVARRVRQRGQLARTVGIKVRFADFRTITRVRTLPEGVDAAAAFHAVALELYGALDLDRPRIRLLGVKGEGLLDADSTAVQLSFDDALVGPVPAASSARAEAGGPVPAAGSGGSGRPAVASPRSSAAIAERTADAARARFGPAAVRPATLLTPRDRSPRGSPGAKTSD
jgi:DNA polymerase-4